MSYSEYRERITKEVEAYAKSIFTSVEQQRTCYHLWVPHWFPDRTYIPYCVECGKVSGQ